MLTLLLAGLLGSGQAMAEPAALALNGDIKTFTLLTLPYDNPALSQLGLWPDTPQGQGIFDARLKLRADLGKSWRLTFHHDISTVVGATTTLGGSGVAATAPELIDLTWTQPGDAATTSATSATSTTIQGRTDRLLLQGEIGPVSLALGRQPVSFGSGLFFTPLDLVSPFFPGTIDTEYKPGVDALRVSAYAGTAFEQRLVVAWVDSCTPVADGSEGCDLGVEDLAIASWSQVTVGVTDLGLFLGEIHDDEVLGASVVTALGPVGVHGDAALTLPPGHLDGRTPTEDIFLRAVLGADWRPSAKATLSGEAYIQTNGVTDPAGYLAQYAGDRYLRGELWAAGRSYLGLNWAQEVLPTLSANLAVVANIEDPSALLIPALSASVGNNASLAVGAYFGLGKRPEGMLLRSELGFLPTTAYSQISTYF
ncbi:MAG: hypothetical protein GXP62_15010 [Oligoflexia bacterium]|nr:hypothetical protein [Oligoflexia bacterium]